MNVPDPTELVRHGYDSVSYRYRGDHDNPAGYAPWLTNLQRRLPTNASVLDLGCGCGIPVAKALTDNGHHVTGVGLSEVQINRARQPKNGPEPRTTGSAAPPPCGGAMPMQPPTASGSPRLDCVSSPNTSCPKQTAATTSSGPAEATDGQLKPSEPPGHHGRANLGQLH